MEKETTEVQCQIKKKDKKRNEREREREREREGERELLPMNSKEVESSFSFSPGSLCYDDVYRHESGRCHIVVSFKYFKLCFNHSHFDFLFSSLVAKSKILLMPFPEDDVAGGALE